MTGEGGAYMHDVVVCSVRVLHMLAPQMVDAVRKQCLPFRVACMRTSQQLHLHIVTESCGLTSCANHTRSMFAFC